MAERLDHFLERAPEGTNMGMIFMDRSDRASESEIRNLLKTAIRKGTPRQQLEHIVGEPVFVKSDRHLGVQLADMVAHIIRRCYNGDSRFEEWFDLIIRAYGPFGRARDCGIKEFPSEG